MSQFQEMWNAFSSMTSASGSAAKMAWRKKPLMTATAPLSCGGTPNVQLAFHGGGSKWHRTVPSACQRTICASMAFACVSHATDLVANCPSVKADDRTRKHVVCQRDGRRMDNGGICGAIHMPTYKPPCQISARMTGTKLSHVHMS